ncbi:hypothetical protein ACT3OH_10670 [Vreelandella zhanjiangensis]|uniref:hypothetical protein n=1 Tax=Vreelandella zhanjiangensis TaxID=1121960 RepID=UPI00402ACF22
MKKCRWSILLLAGLLPLTAQADSIEGTLEGEPREWFILSEGRDSNASYIEVGDQLQVSITGFIEPDNWDAYEALSISLNIEDSQLIDAQVVHLIGNTAMPPLYTSEGGSVTVTLERFEQQGSQVQVAVHIQGVMALQRDLDAIPSQDEGIDIDVQFDVEAYRVEF